MKPSGVLYIAAFATCIAAIITEAYEKKNAKKQTAETWEKASANGGVQQREQSRS